MIHLLQEQYVLNIFLQPHLVFVTLLAFFSTTVAIPFLNKKWPSPLSCSSTLISDGSVLRYVDTLHTIPSSINLFSIISLLISYEILTKALLDHCFIALEFTWLPMNTTWKKLSYLPPFEVANIWQPNLITCFLLWSSTKCLVWLWCDSICVYLTKIFCLWPLTLTHPTLS